MDKRWDSAGFYRKGMELGFSSNLSFPRCALFVPRGRRQPHRGVGMGHFVPGVSPLAIPGALPLSMVFSALRALLRPVDAFHQLSTNGRMRCVPTYLHIFTSKISAWKFLP